MNDPKTWEGLDEQQAQDRREYEQQGLATTLHCGPPNPAYWFTHSPGPITWGSYSYPARYPHRCPVCVGCGQVTAGYYKDAPHSTACRGCGASGVVWG